MRPQQPPPGLLGSAGPGQANKVTEYPDFPLNRSRMWHSLGWGSSVHSLSDLINLCSWDSILLGPAPTTGQIHFMKIALGI